LVKKQGVRRRRGGITDAKKEGAKNGSISIDRRTTIRLFYRKVEGKKRKKAQTGTMKKKFPPWSEKRGSVRVREKHIPNSEKTHKAFVYQEGSEPARPPTAHSPPTLVREGKVFMKGEKSFIVENWERQ